MAKLRVSALLATLGGVTLGGLVLAACQNYGQPKAVADAAGAEGIPDKIDYSWDVRPILSQNCFQCHGNDPKNRKASLRLDIGEGGSYEKLKDEPGKRAIVPGNPNKSEAFRRLTSTDPDYRMPPRDAHKTVSARDVAILEKWIKQGAKYKPHWAYIPVKEAKPQKTEWDKQAVNQIDRYIFAKLKQKGLAPSEEADKETLINRVSLDLTGLPPTLAEVDAFVADTRPDAYERLVDKLLSSTAYAERQAETWLDVARYADSDGYLNDNEGRFQHPYKDWVISAFKRNIPYDRFVTWQLAGDLLPNPTKEQILATGFARSGKKSNEGGIIDEEYRVEYVNERAELIGKAFLGLTVGCAKCHDHKYDVISQADYYSMGGFFNSLDERGVFSGGGRSTPMGPTLAWPTPMQSRNLEAAQKVTTAKWAAYQQALAGARQRVAAAVGKASDRSGFLKAAIEADTQAWYPLDGGYQASLEPLMLSPAPKAPGAPGYVPPKPVKVSAPAGGPGRGGADRGGPAGPGARGPAGPGGPGMAGAQPPARDPDLPRQAGAEVNKALQDLIAKGYTNVALNNHSAVNRRQLMVGLSAEKLQWTASGLPDGKPAFLNNAKFVPGAHGQAVYLNNTVFGADKGVGQFERTDPYTLDVWVKLRPGKDYEDATILYNMGLSKASGYNLLLENNKLKFEIIHSAPYNMIAVQSLDAIPKGRWTHLTVSYDGNSKAQGVKLYVDGQPIQTEILNNKLTRTAKPRGGHSYQTGSYYGFASGVNKSRLEMIDGAIDDVRIITRALTPLEIAWLHDPKAAAAVPADKARDEMVEIAAAKDPAVVKAWQELTDARLSEQRVETPIYQMMVMADQLKPRTNYILDRGLYNAYKGETPTQALPQVFKWDAKLPRNRLGLTQWLFDPKNPMTSRVYVNRLWQGHFGSGIVQTVEDFGTQGSNPTHPELLDYLAIEFMRSGWDIRHMHKLMVMSATYRQASTISKEALEKDPKNFLLARGPRYRLPAEMIRDNALFASGLLIDRVGGDAVFPYQPEGVWDGVGTGVTIYPTEVPKDELHRRTMYTFMKRNAPFPSLAVFDMPDRNVSTVARNISNTPLQALVLLNDTQFVEAYRKLAERVIKADADPDKQIVTLFRLAARRHPTAGETAQLRKFLEAETAILAKDPAKVNELLSNGVAPVDPTLDRTRLAAMTMTAAGVMNSPSAYTLR